MSRIGKKILTVPKGVEIKFDGGIAKVKGPKGTLERKMHPAVALKVEGDKATVVLANGASDDDRKYQGLARTLLANMIEGCTTGFTKSLTLVGVGYRSAVAGKSLQLNLGYSHQIDMAPPAGIEFKVDKQTTIFVSGADKELVGLVAAKIRGLRPPEPYHGKGVRYTDEHIATKVGKASGKK